MLGQDIYDNTPETTTKVFEVSGGGHGSAYESEAMKTLQWAQFHLMNDTDICETLIEEQVLLHNF